MSKILKNVQPYARARDQNFAILFWTHSRALNSLYISYARLGRVLHISCCSVLPCGKLYKYSNIAECIDVVVVKFVGTNIHIYTGIRNDAIYIMFTIGKIILLRLHFSISRAPSSSSSSCTRPTDNNASCAIHKRRAHLMLYKVVLLHILGLNAT